MDNIVYDYDKTSCNYITNTPQIQQTEGYPTNMSVRNCEFPKNFGNTPFRQNIEPKGVVYPDDNSREVYLNPIQNYSKDFKQITVNTKDGPETQYTSSDPRLKSAIRGGRIYPLNAPPVSSSTSAVEILDDTSLDNYGQNYKGYSDTKGDIKYYINKRLEDPFNYPNFSTSATVTGNVFVDPMGSIKPEYNRVPLKISRHVGPDRANYEGGLSWMEDSSNFRQDIMALQMRRTLQESYEPRWYGY